MATNALYEEVKKALTANNDKFVMAYDLLQISKGRLLGYVQHEIKQQLDPEAYSTAKHRIAPINILIKILDKLSPIYRPAPRRTLDDGNAADAEMLEWYETNMQVNKMLLSATKSYVSNQGVFLMPFIHRGLPRLRVLNKDTFLVRSDDTIDPLFPTELITFQRCQDKVKFTIYTEDQILMFTENGDIDQEAMLDNEMNGLNPIEQLPGVYWNRSDSELFPEPSEDMKIMTILISVLFSDLNYAQMFQIFSMWYTVNTKKDLKLKIGPNAINQLDSDLANPDGTPAIGTLSPTVDTNGAITNIQTQLGLWLNSLGIKPGSVGQLSNDQMASGLSKIVDEMDTVELRQSLIEDALTMEKELWDYIINVYHPYAIEQGWIEAVPFTAGCTVTTIFAEQLPFQGRGQLAKDLDFEVKAGFNTTRNAVKRLNTDMTENEVDALLVDIDAEKAKNVAAFQQGQEGVNNDGVGTEVASGENKDPEGAKQKPKKGDSDGDY